MKKVLFLLMVMFAFGIQSVSAQDAPMKIVTNHPDLKVKVKRCAASGKTIILDLTLTNEGTSDVEDISVEGGLPYGSEVYDDEGNIYQDEQVKVKVANKNDYNLSTGSFSILSGVPMKLSFRIDGVSPSAESIARLKMVLICSKWGLDGGKPVIIRNIPISRD